MTFYGPWVQPDDTEAAPSTTWNATVADSTGSAVDPADFATSVSTALAGTGGTPPPSTITAGVSSTAAAPMTQAAKVDLPASKVAAVARLALIAPTLSSLAYPPVIPDLPDGAIGVETEEAEGTPVAGTLRIFGYSVVSATSTGSGNQIGVRLNRLVPGDYTIDGLGRPQSTWTQLITAGTTALTFPPPVTTATYDVAAFNLTGQDLDTNDRAVYTLVDLLLDSTWQTTEASNGQLRTDVPLSPPSSGTLPFFTQFYTPPRYRWIYDVVPPLRQFPRSDGLVGTGGARQRSAGSRQASNRQGWSGTYF